MNDQIMSAVIAQVLEEGDEDQQPWAFYEHDHGGARFPDWTAENAGRERRRFIDTVTKRYYDEVRK
jgi:hypothetical protein